MNHKFHIHPDRHTSPAKQYMKIYILDINQITGIATCYIPRGSHNPSIMGYYLYTFPHQTPE